VILLRLAKFIFIFVVVALILRLIFPSRRAASPAAPPKSGVDLVRDRICNTFVPRSRALPAVVAGREEHFCSTACRDRALALAKAS
jgi:hypothetical protein